jgi:serine/threonine-protein kinase
MEQQIAGHLNFDPPKPTSVNPDIPAGFDDVIARGMAKKPEELYQTATELAKGARQALTTEAAERPAPTSSDATSPRAEPATPAAPPTPAEPAVTAEALIPLEPAIPAEPTLAATHLGDAGIASPVPADQQATQTGPGMIAAPDAQTLAAPTIPRRRPRTKIIAIAAAILVVAAAASITGYLSTRPPSPSPAPPSQEIVLPFTGLDDPAGVAVDRAGSVYVTDYGAGRVLKLAAGANTQSVLPFTGPINPYGVAVDSAGTVYVVDYNAQRGRVLQLAAEATTQSVLPFTGLDGPQFVAVDGAGTVLRRLQQLCV